MLKGFENITHSLTQEELKLIPIVIRILENHKGKQGAITGAEICSYISKTENCKLTGVRLRALIHYITVSNKLLLICSTSNGYFVAETQTEATDYLESLQGRVNSIAEKRDAIEDQVKSRFYRKQLEINL